MPDEVKLMKLILRSWVALIESHPADFDAIAANLLVDTRNLLADLDPPTFGDGHYCTHHPDDPAHGADCYNADKYFGRNTRTFNSRAVAEEIAGYANLLFPERGPMPDSITTKIQAIIDKHLGKISPQFNP